jgi:hypothetical protein
MLENDLKESGGEGDSCLYSISSLSGLVYSYQIVLTSFVSFGRHIAARHLYHMKVRKPVSSWAQSIIFDSLVFPHFIIPQSSPWKICLFTIPVIFYTPRKGYRAIGLVDIIRFALAIHSRTAATKYTISWVGEAFPLFGLQTIESALLNQTVFCMSSLTYKGITSGFH